MTLKQYGYDKFFQNAFAKEYSAPLCPARILAEHRSQYIIMTEQGEKPAALSGKYRFCAEQPGELPVVGDFVAVQMAQTGDRGVIAGTLPRKTCLLRRDAWHAAGVQLLCANIDTVFICMSLNKDFKLSRIERYLVLIKESGARAAVVLTKADLCRDGEIKQALCEAVCREVPVHLVSAVTGQGLEGLLPYFAAGQTVAALGSSGVGKSTLVNALFGQEIMETAEIREDDSRGRHTTVHRQILLLPSGGLYLDTPGLREVGIAQAEDAVSELYSDIEALEGQCRFRDCRHGGEPGCAVREAIDRGELSEKQWQKYVQFKKEARYSQDKGAYLREKTQRFKDIHKSFHSGKKKR